MVRRPRIAIVDDCEDLRLLYALWLSLQYDCAGFSSGEALIAAVERIRPDLLILDAALPGASGFEVAETIRGRSLFQAMPILFLTGLAPAQADEGVRRVDGAGYLSKPVERRALQDSVALILSRQAL